MISRYCCGTQSSSSWLLLLILILPPPFDLYLLYVDKSTYYPLDYTAYVAYVKCCLYLGILCLKFHTKLELKNTKLELKNTKLEISRNVNSEIPKMRDTLRGGRFD